MNCKLSIIHNLYKRNEFVNESVKFNLLALDEAKIDYQYILFNDNGDKDIYEDIKEFGDKVEYIYSDINYGKKMTTGGWVGAIPYLTGDYIHNLGQDDVMTTTFYKTAVDTLDNDKDIYLVSFNGLKVNEDLTFRNFLIHPEASPDYNKPLEIFKEWFGVKDDKLTRANNGLLAPGTIYRRELHKLIGPPDIETFRGPADMEYWTRILFNEYKCKFFNIPTWLYRKSIYSAGNEVIDGKNNEDSSGEDWGQHYRDKIKDKYQELWIKRGNR